MLKRMEKLSKGEWLGVCEQPKVVHVPHPFQLPIAAGIWERTGMKKKKKKAALRRVVLTCQPTQSYKFYCSENII